MRRINHEKQPKSFILYLGIGIFSLGMVLRAIFPEALGIMRSLPFVLAGFGAGIIGVGVIATLRKISIQNNLKKAKAYAISENDERNARIREKAGYVTWHITLFTLALLSLLFAAMNNTVVFLLTFGVLCFHVICLFVAIHIYNKQM